MTARPNYSGDASTATQCTRISTANATRSVSGTISTIYTPGSNGGKVKRISMKAIDDTTAGTITLYTSSNSGSTWRVWKDIAVTSVTTSASTPPWEAELTMVEGELGIDGYDVGATGRIGASPTNAETFDITVSAPSF